MNFVDLVYIRHSPGQRQKGQAKMRLVIFDEDMWFRQEANGLDYPAGKYISDGNVNNSKVFNGNRFFSI